MARLTDKKKADAFLTFCVCVVLAWIAFLVYIVRYLT